MLAISASGQPWTTPPVLKAHAWFLAESWNFNSHRTQSSPSQDAADPTRESLVCCNSVNRFHPAIPTPPPWQRFSLSLYLVPIHRAGWEQTWHSSRPEAANPRQGKGQLSMLADKLTINTEVSGVGKALGIMSPNMLNVDKTQVWMERK